MIFRSIFGILYIKYLQNKLENFSIWHGIGQMYIKHHLLLASIIFF